MNGKTIKIEPCENIKIKEYNLVKTFPKDELRFYSLALCNFSKDKVLIRKSNSNKKQYHILVDDEMYLKRGEIFEAITKRRFKY